MAKDTPSTRRDHVELERRFHELTDEEAATVEDLAVYRAWGIKTGDSWSQLLESERVVLLAEAGSGKTSELKERVRLLVAAGKAAFFIPIEDLQSQGLEDLLAMNEAQLLRYKAWHDTQGEVGWFFVDAVDELKLTHGKLRTALGRLAHALGSARSRARIVLTCRPSDWKPVQDLAEFEAILPAADPEPAPADEKVDRFMLPLRQQSSESTEDERTAPPKTRVVRMLPMDDNQIRTFARSKGVEDPEELLAAIQHAEAMDFARRPLDLARMIQFWRRNGRIGTRLEQHEDDIAHGLRDDPSRTAGEQLAPEQAQEGAERLALALFLTRNRSIRVQERSLEEASSVPMLDPQSVLEDWNEAQIGALLRLPIFDPATYGRVRFHHRSIQEFLAARRLARLLAAGLPRRELAQLLFPSKYGQRVVVPSMRPVAAWLALWDEDVARELLHRAPEALLQRGDPESLPLGLRTRIVDAFTASYGAKEWLGIDLPVSEVYRLAHPDLAPVIARNWGKTSSNSEARELLLKLIWQGKVAACVDLAFTEAMDAAADIVNRVLAVRAAAACERDDLLQALSADMLNHPDRWPARVVFGTVGTLFPRAMEVPALIELIKRTPEPKNTVGGFNWALFRDIAPQLDAKAPLTSALRDALADLASIGFGEKLKSRRARTSFAHLTPAIGQISLSQLRAGVANAGLVRAAVIAVRLHGEGVSGREEINELKAELRRHRGLRESIFETEFAIVKTVTGRTTGQGLFFAMVYEGVLGPLETDDWCWMLRRLGASRDELERATLVHALTMLWHMRGRVDVERDELLTAVKADENLSEHVRSQTTPPSTDPYQSDSLRKEEQEWKIRDRKRNRTVRRSWNRYRARVNKDPIAAFTGTRKDDSLYNAVQWLGFYNGDRNSHGRSNWREFGAALGAEAGQAFEQAIRSYWRLTAAPIVSRRPARDANLIFGSVEVALTGLAAEASDEHWTASISEEEATRAAEWATLEINGFPEWLAALVAAFPRQVKQVLDREIRSELSRGATRMHPTVVSAVEYGPEVFKRLVAPTVRDKLMRWPRLPAKQEDQSHHVRNAQRLIRILHAANALDSDLIDVLEARFLADPESLLGSTWLQAIFAHSLERGLRALDRVSSNSDADAIKKIAPGWMAALFGERDSARIPVEIAGEAQTLLSLIRHAYGFVRMEDDVHHEGSYSPDLRDDAQTARSNLVKGLMDRPGADSHAALMELANEPYMAHRADRLRLAAQERAAIDAEPRAWSASEVVGWEREHSRAPQSRDELFDTMLNRLEDIAHDIQHADFSDRALLAQIKDEKVMQPRIAAKLADRARGHFQVVREEEVADKKEPDIRLVASQFAGKAAIEIKIGDSWSVRELEAAVRDQLLGQYLRHDTCTAGCLLVTYAGRKGFEHPDTGATMSFSDVIEHLQNYAATLEAAELGRVRLTVFGLDLRSPLPEPAAAKSTKARKPRNRATG